MIKAYSSAARLSVSSSIARFRLTRYSSTVTQSRISVSSLLNRETASPDGPADDLVTINGFVRSIRKQKRVAFAAIGDGTTIEPLQAVLTPDQANGYDSASPEGVPSVNVTLHLDSHQVPQ
jgi:asparaginyl-tRNA synthetase